MGISRGVPAALLGLALLLGPMAVRADCCPPLDTAGPDVAAFGCCGHCPTQLAPTPEPASLTAKAAPVTALAPVGVAAAPVVAALAITVHIASAIPSPREPPVSRAAPLRL